MRQLPASLRATCVCLPRLFLQLLLILPVFYCQTNNAGPSGSSKNTATADQQCGIFCLPNNGTRYTFGLVNIGKTNATEMELTAYRLFYENYYDKLPECVRRNRSFVFKSINMPEDGLQLAHLESTQKLLKEEMENLLFIGGEHNYLLDILVDDGIPSRAGLSRLVNVPYHDFFSFPMQIGIDLTTRVVKDILGEGIGHKGIIIYGNADIDDVDLRQLVGIFTTSFYVLAYNDEDPEKTMLELLALENKANRMVIVLADHHQSAIIAEKAVSHGLLHVEHKWVFFNSRVPFNQKLKLLGKQINSPNVISIEFGSFADSYNLLNTTFDVLLNDMMGIWSVMLPYIFECAPYNTTEAKLNTTFYKTSSSGEFRIENTAVTRKSWQMYFYSNIYDVDEIGYWFNDSRYFFQRVLPRTDKSASALETTRREGLKLVTIIDPPYVQYINESIMKDDKVELKDKLEGYAFDLMAGILEKLKIPYTIELEPSGLFGKPVSWDIEVPFDYTMWLALLGSIVGTTLFLAFINYLNPNEKNYGLWNSLFFSIGTAVQGFTMTPPNRASGRVIVCFYWLFCLVVIIAYFCNFGAILTSRKIVGQQLSGFHDLLKQDVYEFGTMGSSSVETYFEKSETEENIKIYQRMADSGNFFNTTTEILERVNNGTFAYIYTDAMNGYYARKFCDLKTHASAGSFHLRYIFRIGAPWEELIDDEIYKADEIILDDNKNPKEKSILAQLEKKYFDTSKSPPECIRYTFLSVLNEAVDGLRNVLQMPPFTNDKFVLDLRYTLGIWIISVVGCVLSLSIAFCEYGYEKITERLDRRKTSIRKQKHMKTLARSKYESYA